MQQITHPTADQIKAFCRRPAADVSQLHASVSQILADVAKRGDDAVLALTEQYDNVTLTVDTLRVQPNDIAGAEAQLDDKLKSAIQLAAKNIASFHASQSNTPAVIETMPGVRCWRKQLPIANVGLYIPGGSAPLFSSVLMLGVPARVAGCTRVVVCTPPQPDGSVHPAILYAAQVAGVQEVFKVGGAQAIAAMAHGTATIPKVDKIFGPGNAYVTAAKQLAQLNGVAIDLPAGPSEVCVVADESADAEVIAADLLSQAEHGPDSQVLFITTHAPQLEAVESAVQELLKQLPRAELAREALTHSTLVAAENDDHALEIVNTYAPEHLILLQENARTFAERVLHAGSIFLGPLTPESFGDYASGTNHTLPTAGYARAYSGCSLDSFVKNVTYQEVDEKGFYGLSDAVISMAKAESLDAHALAVEVRKRKLEAQ